ncbi:hypothetical protein ABFU26_10980 [Xanthomonas campestris pv. raphani]|uniref:hypothetical protein n=1 Tax=Xanthomonas TaxID=338 RepID=UPI000573EA98|nr:MULTISPECIES: hypothetical protein [Xanthomonas]KHL57071.1 hypothetical protein OZ10_07425 [Xanthomonas cannabis pv. cannabis]MCC8553638.1 hypothetical protein [Xanthomonas hortorum pv. gardneri]
MSHPAYQIETYREDYPDYPDAHIGRVIESTKNALTTSLEYKHLPEYAKKAVACLIVRYTLAGRDFDAKLALRGSIDAIVWGFPK